jgi:hypothetical protein
MTNSKNAGQTITNRSLKSRKAPKGAIEILIQDWRKAQRDRPSSEDRGDNGYFWLTKPDRPFSEGIRFQQIPKEILGTVKILNTVETAEDDDNNPDPTETPLLEGMSQCDWDDLNKGGLPAALEKGCIVRVWIDANVWNSWMAS